MTFYAQPEHQPFDVGDGEVGVLLIHGFPGTPAEVLPLGKHLATQNMRAKGILLPGFGQEIARLNEMDREAWLTYAAAIWQEMRLEHKQTVLIGFSMGGALATQLAAAHPPDQLILLAPFWRFSNWLGNLLPVAKLFMKELKPFEKANFDDPQVREQMKDIAEGIDLSDPEVQERLREEIRLPTAVLDEVRRLGKEAYQLAPQVDAPTLIIQGRQDDTVRPSHTAKLAARFNGQSYYTEIDGGHDFPKWDTHHWLLVNNFIQENA